MKKIIKNPVFMFILGSIIFGSIGIVSAYTILAKDVGYTPKDTTWKVNNVEDAINDLKGNCQSGDIDNYNDKNYIQDNLTVYSNRVTILDGGYFIDEDNTVWVNLSIKTNVTLGSNNSYLIIKGLPDVNDDFVVTSNDRKYGFLIGHDWSSSNKNSISFFDYMNRSLPANTELTLQFKYNI